MKNNRFVFMAVAIVCFCSCGNTQSKSDEGQQQATDSLAEAERASFRSLDLDGYNLIGHVKECTMKSYDKTGKKNDNFRNLIFTKEGLIEMDEAPYRGKLSFEYGESGKFLEGKDLATEGMRVILKRDSDGRIQSIQRKAATGAESDTQYELKYSYDKEGRLKGIECVYWEASEDIAFTYNKGNAFVATEKSSFSDYEVDAVITKTYTYTELDPYGNWLTREVAAAEEKSVTEMGEETATTTRKNLPVVMEKREIQYW